jgi:hypothetical protein
MGIIDHPDQWPPDFHQTSKLSTVDYVFLARALSRFDRDDIWKGLCSGELKAWGSSKERADFAPKQLSPMRFSNQTAAKGQILDDCAIDAMDHRSARRIPVPHWIYVTRTSLDRFEKELGPKATIGAETRAIAHLKSLLEGNNTMSKNEARRACEQFKLSGAGFDDRVWPEARHQAGLSRQAPSGRKRLHKPKKSGRKSGRKSSR